jgi:hypothetical protein
MNICYVIEVSFLILKDLKPVLFPELQSVCRMSEPDAAWYLIHDIKGITHAS